MATHGQFADFERLTAADAECFLTDLANPARDEPKPGQRFLARYGHVLRDQISIGILKQVCGNIEGRSLPKDELLRTYWLDAVAPVISTRTSKPSRRRKARLNAEAREVMRLREGKSWWQITTTMNRKSHQTYTVSRYRKLFKVGRGLTTHPPRPEEKHQASAKPVDRL